MSTLLKHAMFATQDIKKNGISYKETQRNLRELTRKTVSALNMKQNPEAEVKK